MLAMYIIQFCESFIIGLNYRYVEFQNSMYIVGKFGSNNVWWKWMDKDFSKTGKCVAASVMKLT